MNPSQLLGLLYPGGPLIDKYAAEGNPNAFKFPSVDTPGLNFSFSGIKTAFLYFLRDHTAKNTDFIEKNLNDICASIQYTIIQILMDKLKLAVAETGIKQITIGGGVSANSGIRNTLKEAETKYGWKTYIPKFEYTTDNAAMIGIVGYYNFLEENFSTSDVVSKARIEF